MILTVSTRSGETYLSMHGTCVCNRLPQSMINCLGSKLCSSNPLRDPEPKPNDPIEVSHARLVLRQQQQLRHMQQHADRQERMLRYAMPIVFSVLGIFYLVIARQPLPALLFIGYAFALFGYANRAHNRRMRRRATQ